MAIMQVLLAYLSENIQYVTGGFSLLAFIIGAVVLLAKYNLDNRKELISQSTGEEKIKALEAVLEYFGVDTEGLTKQQKYNIAMEQIKNKRHRLNLNAFILCFISVIFAGVATYTIANTDNRGGGKGKDNDDNSSSSTTPKPIADITVHQPPLQLAISTQTKPIVRVINKSDNNAQEENNNKKDNNADNKKIFDVPEGMLKGDIDVDGDWIPSDKGDVFKYKQDFMGYPFIGTAFFKQGVARNPVLTLEKYYSEYYWEKDGVTKKDIKGEEGAPGVYCLGDQYKSFVNKLIREYGSSVGKPTVYKEDVSSKMDDLSGWCAPPVNASCSKSGGTTKITREFKDDSGNNVLIFTAFLDSRFREFSMSDRSGSNNYMYCSWTLKLK